jgi:hypothetical protein
MVFTLPKPIADIAYQNKAAVYDILFKAAAKTLITIAAHSDPKRPLIPIHGIDPLSWTPDCLGERSPRKRVNPIKRLLAKRWGL